MLTVLFTSTIGTDAAAGAAVLFPQIPHGGFLPFIQREFAHPDDIFLVNFAAWHRDAPLHSYHKALANMAVYYQVTRV